MGRPPARLARPKLKCRGEESKAVVRRARRRRGNKEIKKKCIWEKRKTRGGGVR